MTSASPNVPEQVARNQDRFRELNESIEPSNAAHAWFDPSMPDWACECARVDCSEPVTMTIAEYEAVRAHPTHFLIRPSAEHLVPEVERVVERHDRYWVVEKVGPAGHLSELLDDRGEE